MAEVYRARGKGADGRIWQYAVKRILPELTQNEDLREMFVEEARVASMLVHPNIVRVYDLAKSELDELYIVMEFLEGRDLAEAIDRAIDLGRTMPVWLSIHVAREILHALHYATTTAVDKEGRALGLIHRDISPHNIFVCFDGQVKLTDFGVAKVAQSSVLTQVGVTKGKFGYMSPEQLMSERLDFRSDLYNVGILLYETLTARKLFHGDNASQFLQAMLRAEVPALDPALGIPPELEALMRRALSKDREDRPSSPAQFDAELFAVGQQYGLLANGEHLANELRAVFGSEIESCSIGERVGTAPKRLASIAAALPEAVQRAPSRVTPLSARSGNNVVAPVQIVPAQEKSRGLSEPSIEIRQSPLDLGLDRETPLETPLDMDAVAAATLKRPVAPRIRPKTKPNEPAGSGAPRASARQAQRESRSQASSAPRPGTRSVRAIDDDPVTIPPDSADDPSPDAPTLKNRATVIVGGNKAIGIRVDDDDDWLDKTTGEDVPAASRGGIVTRSRRVLPLPPKKP